ncbi:MAG: hypothetical protein MI757_18570 [Pirellulales bacterium]|nr:hypothetical protein [Pirellulales bacterium]
MYKQGDPVVYRVQKCTERPGPRAKHIDPAEHGDFYSYVVDKFWIVDRVLDSGKLLLKTRRGKRHVISQSDPNLHRAHWWERIAHHQRFPAMSK